MKIKFPERRYPAMVKPNQAAANINRKKRDEERYNEWRQRERLQWKGKPQAKFDGKIWGKRGK